MPEQRPISIVQSTLPEAASRQLSSPMPSTLAEALGIDRGSAKRKPGTRAYVLRRLLLATDVLALLAAFAMAELVLSFFSPGRHVVERDSLLLAVAIPVWVLFARAHNLYHVDSSRADHSAAEELAPIVWMTTLWSWGILLLGTVLGVRSVSIYKLAAFWAATVFLLVVLRSIVRAWSRRQAWYRQNTIIVCTLRETATLMSKIRRHPEYGIDVVACVELAGAQSSRNGGHDTAIGTLPMLRGDVDLVELLGELDVDRVIFGSSLHELPDYQQVLSELREFNVHVDVVPSWFEVVGSCVDLHELEGMPLVALPSTSLPRSSLLCKRALDCVLATVGVLVLMPLLMACALAIKLDSPGPVLFRQRRVGRGDRRFWLLKFRSMRADADQIKDDVADLNFHGGGNDRGMFKVDGDPRITRVGRLLRRYSLDELPQLINVLCGDMSLVGPRPLIENEDCQIAGRHRRRITLTPGLTGLWQVNGRSDIPFEGMIDLDYLYVTNWSLWGDIKLLMRTFGAVLRGHGAY